MTVVHSSPALHTAHRSTQECLEAYARTEENPVLLGQALAAGCTLDKCSAECRSLSEHEELFAENRKGEDTELHEMTSPTDEV